MDFNSRVHTLTALMACLLLAVACGTSGDKDGANSSGGNGDSTPGENDISLGSFEACSDGLTVADLETGLLWERKTGTFDTDFPSSGFCVRPGECLDRHDVNNRYEWSTTGTAADGFAFTDFLVDLNTDPGFAGHTDWRLPFVSELQSILVGSGVTIAAVTEPPDLLSGTNPTGQSLTCSAITCVDPDFAAIGGPTAGSYYWSSLSAVQSELGVSDQAYLAAFFPEGGVRTFPKNFEYFVRAVRAGSCGS